MACNKEKETEDTQQQNGIEYLRRFLGLFRSGTSESTVRVVKRKERLYYPGNQKKVINLHKKEHLPLTDFCSGRDGFFVNTILIMRNTVNFISWNICSPDILSINFKPFQTLSFILSKFFLPDYTILSLSCLQTIKDKLLNVRSRK